MTGGSMLYIDAICKGIDDIPDIDPELRKNLKNRLELEGIESLRLLLKKLDPDYYSQADLKNPARIVHALEICMMTGKPYSYFRKEVSKKRSFNIVKTALNCDRAELHNRINRRVDDMITGGLEQEAFHLFPLRHLNSLNTVGYREFFDYFEGKTSKEEAIDLIKRNTRRYARKQITWFRKDADVNWFRPDEIPNLIEFINKSIQNK
jgi:tRNA dimethylallyltransferase